MPGPGGPGPGKTSAPVIVKNLLYRFTALVLGFSLAFGLAEITVRVLCPQEVGTPCFAFETPDNQEDRSFCLIFPG